MRLSSLFIPVLLLGTSLFAATDYEVRAKARFDNALTAYNQTDYETAAETLRQVLKSFGRSRAAEKAAVMLTDIYLRQGQSEKAERTIERFGKYFLGSAEKPRMLYFEGVVAFQKDDYFRAARLWTRALNTTQSASLFANAGQALRHLALNRGLTTGELREILEELSHGRELHADLLRTLGIMHAEKHQIYAARVAYEDWLKAFSDLPGRAEVEQSLREVMREKIPYVSVLIMAPLTGDFREIGENLAQGIILALEEFNRRGGTQIQYQVLDTEASSIVAIQRLRKVLRQENIAAVIGPAMSEVATAVAIELSSRRSPVAMVTPTATTHGIAALGDGIFQLNVSTATLGHKVAEYALECLKLKEFAVFAPRTEYGYQLASAFGQKVVAQGGTLLATEFYDPDGDDFGEHFKSLRKVKARLDYERTRIEKDLPTDGNPNARALAGILSDSVLTVDGIFIAANNAEEAYKLASQTRYHKLNGQLLGGSGWYDRKLLHQNSRSLHGAVISVDFPDDEEDAVQATFRKNFEGKWNRKPDRVAALGYNGGRFVTEAINSAAGGETLIPALRSLKGFTGVKGDIILSPSTGANVNTALLKVGKRNFEPITNCPALDSPAAKE